MTDGLYHITIRVTEEQHADISRAMRLAKRVLEVFSEQQGRSNKNCQRGEKLSKYVKDPN